MLAGRRADLDPAGHRAHRHHPGRPRRQAPGHGQPRARCHVGRAGRRERPHDHQRRHRLRPLHRSPLGEPPGQVARRRATGLVRLLGWRRVGHSATAEPLAEIYSYLIHIHTQICRICAYGCQPTTRSSFRPHPNAARGTAPQDGQPTIDRKHCCDGPVSLPVEDADSLSKARCDSRQRRDQIENVDSRLRAEGGLSAASCQAFGLIGHAPSQRGGGGWPQPVGRSQARRLATRVRCVRDRGPGTPRRPVAVLSAGRPRGRLRDPGR